MIEVARTKKPQAPPPNVIFEALTQPHRDPTREWLRLETGEIEPTVLDAREFESVVWSTLWPNYPSATIAFEMTSDKANSGSVLTWTLEVEPPAPDPEAIRLLRHRINELVNRDMRNILFDC